MRQLLHNLFWWSVEVSNRDRDVVQERDRLDKLLTALGMVGTILCLVVFRSAGMTDYRPIEAFGVILIAVAFHHWQTRAFYTPWRQPSAETEIVLRKPLAMQLVGIVLSAVMIPLAGGIALTIFVPPFYPGKTLDFSAGLLVFLIATAASVSAALPWEMRIDLRQRTFSVSNGIPFLVMPRYGAFEDIAGLFVRHVTRDHDFLYVKWKRRRWPMLIGQFPPGTMAATQGRELTAAMGVLFLD